MFGLPWKAASCAQCSVGPPEASRHTSGEEAVRARPTLPASPSPHCCRVFSAHCGQSCRMSCGRGLHSSFPAAQSHRWMGKKALWLLRAQGGPSWRECEVRLHSSGVLAPGPGKLSPAGAHFPLRRKATCFQRRSGGQFHLARPAFPVWFVAIGNKLEKSLPSHPSWQQCWQLILRKKKKGKKKTLKDFFPLCALILGRCPQHLPISLWTSGQERW